MNHHDIARIANSMPKLDLQNSGVIQVQVGVFSGLEIILEYSAFRDLYPCAAPRKVGGAWLYEAQIPGGRVIAVSIDSERAAEVAA